MNIPNINQLPWQQIRADLNKKGFASISNLLDHQTCDELVSLYEENERYRKTVVMERHRFGLGEYKYFNYPLPGVVGDLRTIMYPYLAEIANKWMQVLNIDTRYPAQHEEFLATCHANEQRKPTPLILKYGEGGYNTLHQDLYGSVYFPLQLAIFLSDYGKDYHGGEFVLTEQVPRSQSKAMVVTPGKGDAVLFATNFRPVKGSRGYYRTNLRHGVSELKAGSRYTLGIIFHDATT